MWLMRKQSERPDSIRVVLLQHSSYVVSSIGEVISAAASALIGAGQYSSLPKIADALGIDHDHFYAARVGSEPLGDAKLFKLIALLDDESVRSQLKDNADDAIRYRNATRRIGGFSFEGHSAWDIWTRCKKNPEFSSLSLHRVMAFLGLPVRPVNEWAVDDLIEFIVGASRRRFGEIFAYKASIILLHDHLNSMGRGDPFSRLNLIFVTIDLASQVNDWRVQELLVAELERLKGDLTCNDEVWVLERLVVTCSATIIRHRVGFSAGSKGAVSSYSLVCDALKRVDISQRGRMFMVENPRFTFALTSAHFLKLQIAIDAGLPPGELLPIIELHDAAVEVLNKIGYATDPIGPAMQRELPLDPYRSEAKADLKLQRPDRANTVVVPQNVNSWDFDPDYAIRICSNTLASLDEGDDRSAETLRASLHRTLAEAYLCRHVRDVGKYGRWNGDADNYRTARSNALDAFSRLNMKWKLRKLARLELSAGFIAEDHGVAPLGRKSRREKKH
jgi:hypothetical protein